MYKYFTDNPRALFVLDGIGAMVSSVMLGIVLVSFQSLVGIPVQLLYFLAVFPLFFGILDVCAYQHIHIIAPEIYVGWLLVTSVTALFLLLVHSCILSPLSLWDGYISLSNFLFFLCYCDFNLW